MPVHALSGDRLRNFLALRSHYRRQSGVELVVSEQRSDSMLEDPADVTIPARRLFNKAACVNAALATLDDDDWLWQVDADVMIPYAPVLSGLLSGDRDAYRPFAYVVRLLEEETLSFLRDGRVTVRTGSEREQCAKLGPLSFAARARVLRSFGGMDETFSGFGWEDLDLARKLRTACEVGVMMDVRGIHLHHSTDDGSRLEQAAANAARYALPRNTKISALTKGASPRMVYHAIAPALIPQKRALLDRETIALESVEAARTVNVDVVLFTDGESDTFVVSGDFRSSSDVGDARRLPSLAGMLLEGLASGRDAVVYTNSDCCITPDFYSRVLRRLETHDAVCMHRLDVTGGATTLSGVMAGRKRVFDLGVDGIAFRRSFLQEFAKKVPEFYVGEPHWDTALAGFLDRTASVSHDAGCLLHPVHERAWDLDSLSPAGKHNDALYRDMVEYGLCDAQLQEVMATVVVVHYGRDPSRLETSRRNLDSIRSQALRGEYLLVEATEDGESCFPNLAGWRHVLIRAREGCRDIWQKEQMMNVGLSLATFPVVVFVDGDVTCPDPDWLYDCARIASDNPGSAVQGFRTVRDSVMPERWSFASYGSSLNGFSCDLPLNPGVCWAFDKEMLDLCGGFNPHCLYGNGDSLLLAEYAGVRDPCVRDYPRMRELVREMPVKPKIMYAAHDLTHQNHGAPLTLEEYGAKNEVTRGFRRRMDEMVEVDPDSRLLRWVDPDCDERGAIAALRRSSSQLLEEPRADGVVHG